MIPWNAICTAIQTHRVLWLLESYWRLDVQAISVLPEERLGDPSVGTEGYMGWQRVQWWCPCEKLWRSEIPADHLQAEGLAGHSFTDAGRRFCFWEKQHLVKQTVWTSRLWEFFTHPRSLGGAVEGRVVGANAEEQSHNQGPQMGCSQASPNSALERDVILLRK